MEQGAIHRVIDELGVVLGLTERNSTGNALWNMVTLIWEVDDAVDKASG